jgi:hypothetical protein
LLSASSPFTAGEFEVREGERPLDNVMLAILSEGEGITMLVAVDEEKSQH